MPYEEFWERDYRLAESWALKGDIDLDKASSLIFLMFEHLHASNMLQIWAFGDKKSRGQAPEVPTAPYPLTASAKRDAELEKAKNNEIRMYLDSLRG